MPIPTTIESLSTTAASNGPAGSEQRTLADDGLRQSYAFIRQLVTKGADIASSATITPPSTGQSFSITGTTGISTIASTNSWDGRTITLIFAGALTLTHSSNLALPGSANITTAANDVAQFVQTGSGAWRCINYRRAADGEYLPLAGGTITGDLTVNGNTALGNAAADTLSVSGSTIKNATGNWAIPAPSSGVALTVSGVSGANPVAVNMSEAGGRFIAGSNSDGAGAFGFSATAGGTVVGVLQASASSNQVQVGSNSAHLLRLITSGSNRVDITSSGNVTVNAPGSGTALTVSPVAGQAALAITGASTGAVAAISVTDGTVTSVWQASNSSIAHVGTTSSHAFNLMTNSATRLAIAAAGNVTVNAPSSGVAMTVTSAGGGSAGIACVTSLSGAVNYIFSDNTSNTASSDSMLYARVAGTSAGDAYLRLDVSGTTTIAFGIDNSDSDAIKLTTGANPSSGTSLLGVETDGRVWGGALHNTGTVTGTTKQYIASGTYTPTLTNTTNITASTASACQWLRVGNVVTVSGKVSITGNTANLSVLGMTLPIASAISANEQLGGTGAVNSGAVAQHAASIEGDPTNDRATWNFLNATAGAQNWFFTFQYVVL